MIQVTLCELRKSKGITQKIAAEFVGIPLRTYCDYETKPEKQNGIKYSYMLEKLSAYGYVDEENGMLSIEEIRRICSEVLGGYSVEYCYLFGSYAKGKATCASDVDLLVCTPVSGMRFFELVETLRTRLRKKVDVLDHRQLNSNPELVNEILKDGIKIYG